MKKLLLLLLLSAPAMAGINDPWYLAYKVSGGTLTQYMGPFPTRVACHGARFSLPIGAQFIGCYQ